MNNSNQLSWQIKQSYLESIVNRFFQIKSYGMKLEYNSQKERWIMELIQNAQDFGKDGEPVKIRLYRGKDKLIFSYNGRPFQRKELFALIGLDSTKERKNLESVGNGIGTIYWMDNVVELTSFLQEEDSLRKFHLKMDRRGRTKQKLMTAIEKDWMELEKPYIEKENSQRGEEEYGTSFLFPTKRWEGYYDYPDYGFYKLRDLAMYILLFCDKIECIELIDEEPKTKEQEKLLFEKGSDREVPNCENIRERIIYKNGKPHYFHYMTKPSYKFSLDENDNITLAAEYDKETGYQKVPKNIERIFRGVPILGTENFPFPMILHSSCFCPKEFDKEVKKPSKGYYQVDNNWEILCDAMEIYDFFVKEAVAANLLKVEHLMDIPGFRDKEGLSAKWFQKNIYDRLYQVASMMPEISEEEKDRLLYLIRDTEGIFGKPDIPKVLQEVCDRLDVLDAQNSEFFAKDKIKFKNKRYNIDFILQEEKRMLEFPILEVANYIKERTNRNYAVSDFEKYEEVYLTAWREAWGLMVSCGPDQKLYEVCQKGGMPLLPYQPIHDIRFPAEMWRPSAREMLGKLLGILELMEDISDMPNGEYEAFLNDILEVACRYFDTSELTDFRIYPNQQHKQQQISSLKIDQIQYPELKEIAVFIGTEKRASMIQEMNVYQELLSKEVKLPKPWVYPRMDDYEVANRIKQVLVQVFNEKEPVDTSLEFKEGVKKLLSWLQEHPEEAKRYFPEYAKKEQQNQLEEWV